MFTVNCTDKNEPILTCSWKAAKRRGPIGEDIVIGKTPMETLQDSKKLTEQKMLDQLTNQTQPTIVLA